MGLPTHAVTARRLSTQFRPGSCRRRALLTSKASWSGASALRLRMLLSARRHFLANGVLCAATGDERCPAAVDVVIRQGLPILTAASAQAGFAEACNAAVPGTCSARLF